MKINELTEIKKRTPAHIPQGMATKKMYGTEAKVLEKLWDMKRPRSYKANATLLKLLWDHYAPLYNVRRAMPDLEYGPGTMFGGRALSYTVTRGNGKPWLIQLAPGERNFYVLVHELVHALGPNNHGVKFAKVYHDLLSHDMFQEFMNKPLGRQFLNFLKSEHPQFVRKAYRNR